MAKATLKAKSTPAEELDRMFDDGEDISEYLDQSTSVRPNLVNKRVNVDCPSWMIRDLDLEADRIGVSRQALIKVWLAERLQSLKSAKSAT